MPCQAHSPAFSVRYPFCQLETTKFEWRGKGGIRSGAEQERGGRTAVYKRRPIEQPTAEHGLAITRAQQTHGELTSNGTQTSNSRAAKSQIDRLLTLHPRTCVPSEFESDITESDDSPSNVVNAKGCRPHPSSRASAASKTPQGFCPLRFCFFSRSSRPRKEG